ncbi:hypothetical protein [Rickettsiella endosymbiont of Dermanyssus gallinae]|uniref:hypothetical protein n=1 Tax=Rickettsiella endosymbiont of Dermanyssus gallinae TaxID=2856608 RepID=UPI001C531B0E|nr:hypothetical protein [Rickettsiella endosymbiont of Dermanyssus gallinae]
MKTILITTLLNTVITKLTAIRSLVDHLDGIQEVHQQIVDKLNNAIFSLKNALAHVNTNALVK